ncbi:MAG: di-trans,poly-cis-decaprenylcistransferase [Treponema sp.]|jgi:undecaprenyl diphosphate synthase|nr:di-trans,poly-cis-decaprenylcistransferase [Treponema sp.]
MPSLLKPDYPRIPAHVGIIMDGNGRWARRKNQTRTQGHLEGLNTAKRIVKTASDMGISFLTLYVFSTENWKRTAEEVGFIMGLVKRYLAAEMDFYRKNRIRIRHTGAAEGLPPEIAREIQAACEETKVFEGLQVILALNYGGRDEIVRAVRRILGTPEATETAGFSSRISEELIRQNLDNPDVPDPDLIIRTGGEYRISNFLLWEGAYAEYYFSDRLWPDWTEEDFAAAIRNFAERDRRFGDVKK